VTCDLPAQEDGVPLSEEELRLLEQMERALIEEDPKFASALRGHGFQQSARRRVILAAITFVAGIVLLMTGAITSVWVVGIAGFLIMLASATIGITALRGRALTRPHLVSNDGADARQHHPASKGRGKRPRRSFMRTVEERWQRRRDSGLGW